MKYYQVIFIDEYNNFYEIGCFKSLQDAEPEVNFHLNLYIYVDEDGNSTGEAPEFGEGKNLDHLVEYASTFGPVFDRVIDVEEGCVQIKGFIKYTEDTIQEMTELEGK